MMKREFERIAGYEVSDENYEEIIEPMYLSINIDKNEFVKLLDKNRFALRSKNQIILDIKKDSIKLYESCEHFTDYEANQRIECNCKELSERFGGIAYIESREKPYTTCYYPKILVMKYENIILV